MKIAITGATGFLGRYIVADLTAAAHDCRCWYRDASDRAGLEMTAGCIEWSPGELGDQSSTETLVRGCDVVVHAALMRTGRSFRGGEGDLLHFTEVNLLGTLHLIEAARRAGVQRFIFISTCAVHERILHDRPLDECHPLWPLTHYGAHKAAIEKFVHSFGMGLNYPVCALRPTGIYGAARPLSRSKWFDLVHSVRQSKPVECTQGGKEVHAADVARAVNLLITADDIAGESFNCYDRYISEYEVATITQEITGSQSEITGVPRQPQHQIATDKIRRLGMDFGGEERLRATIQQLLEGTD